MLSALYRNRNFKPALLSCLVFALLGACTLSGYRYARQQEEARIGHAFDELSILKAQRVILRVEGYARTLLDLRGLFVADPDVSHAEFKKYLDGVEVTRRYAALLRIGYAPRVTEANRDRLENLLRLAGLSNYEAAPDDFPILYGYPSSDAVLGKSLSGRDQLRGEVLNAARDTDEPQISTQVALRFDSGHRPGFVLYVPLYGGGLAPATLAQRRQALSGYLFAAFRTEDLIDSTIGKDLERQMDMALFDGPSLDASRLAYDSGIGLQPMNNGSKTYASTQRTEVSGRPWTFLFIAGPVFVKANQSTLPTTVLLAGLLTSTLTAWLANAAMRRWLAERTILHQALHDELTGLPNRAKLRISISEAIRHEQETKQPCALLIVELLRFSDINYTLGHLIGDEVLAQASARIRALAGKDAVVARISNVQFGVLLPDAGIGAAIDCARRLVGALEEPLPARDSKYELGARAGIVCVPIHGSDVDDLIRHADIALNLARSSGAGYVIYDAQLDPYQPQRLTLLSAFRQAVKEDQLQLFCQPKADLRTGMITSVEALVRWQHPEYGLIMPDQFISLIEPTELIHLLTERMLESAMRQCYAWRQQALFLPLAVNLSARNLLNPALPELIGSMMQTWGADASWVELEITESSIMDDPALSQRVLDQLHGMGIKLSVDDFGTGYSSLSYLMKLPIAVIKIDRSFTVTMMSDPDAAAIVKAIIELAHNMGLKVVAEGVASKEIWDALARLDCDEAQGYYISPPFAAHELRSWLDRSGWRLAPS